MIRKLSENIRQYIIDRTGLDPDTVIDTDLFPGDPDEIVWVKDVGGPPREYPNRNDWSVSVFSRAGSSKASSDLINLVWNAMRDPEHGVTLPASLVVTGSAEVATARISCTSPSSLGMSGKYYEWTFTINVTFFDP